MTKEKKFRAVDVDYNCLRYFTLRDIRGYGDSLQIMSMDGQGYHFVDVNSIQQFTGFKDKSKNEIYEGDIFHLGDINIKYLVLDCVMAKQLTNESKVGLDYWQDNIVLVGNTVDNPELIK